MTSSTNPIACKKPFAIKALNGLFIFGMIILIDGNIILWLGLLFLILNIWIRYPDIVISDVGIQILRLGRTRFLTWDRILNVRVRTFYFRVYPKMPIVARIFCFESFLIMSWYTNYQEALSYIESQLDTELSSEIHL